MKFPHSPDSAGTSAARSLAGGVTVPLALAVLGFLALAGCRSVDSRSNASEHSISAPWLQDAVAVAASDFMKRQNPFNKSNVFVISGDGLDAEFYTRLTPDVRHMVVAIGPWKTYAKLNHSGTLTLKTNDKSVSLITLSVEKAQPNMIKVMASDADGLVDETYFYVLRKTKGAWIIDTFEQGTLI